MAMKVQRWGYQGLTGRGSGVNGQRELRVLDLAAGVSAALYCRFGSFDLLSKLAFESSEATRRYAWPIAILTSVVPT